MNARVVLVVDESSPVVRLIEGLASLEQQSLPQHALIGGLAVMCRLATAHRPTADVDTLARDDAIPSAVEVLVARGATRTTTGVELAGVRIDIYRLLETHDTGGSLGRALLDAPGDLADWCSEQIERLFVTEPERTFLLIGNALAPGTFALVPDDLRTVGEAFFV